MAGSRLSGMVLVAFMQAQNCSNYAASWRHREGATDFLAAEYYQRIARILEDGKFHLAFCDDRLSIPDRYEDGFAETLRRGIRAVKLDPVPVMMAMGLATRRLGIGATYSTTYHEPFHVARLYASMDHMLGGRAAWNVVTSLNDGEAGNFGREEHLPHDVRYDRADEFMEAVLGHWDSWDDGAVVYDRARGIFADPARVHRLEHRGEWFRSRGPFTVPRTPQGRPVIMQAGQSGRGRRFAARWSELIFAVYPEAAAGRAGRRALDEELALAGRAPEEVKIATAVFSIVGESRAEALEKQAYVESLAEPLDKLVLLSEGVNFDFASRPLDLPLSDADLATMSGLQGILEGVKRASGKSNPTVRDFATFSRRGTVREFPNLVGTAADVADQLEDWYSSGGCDGFVIAATHVPGAYEEFVRMVVPELQRRGIYHQDYEGATLRENLGLAHADVGDWH